MITAYHLKAIKKRGNYFHAVIDVPFAQKYNTTPLIIGEVRRLAIFKKQTQQEICIKITNALSSGAYQRSGNTPTKYGSLDNLIKTKNSVLSFVLRLSPEAFDEITQLTKYDWDYQGEDRKLPDRKEYHNYLKAQKELKLALETK